jgi:uncharacterized protein YgbK (DUF1537 family)
MILGCIADDFTGAGDLASILTGQGMRTSLLTSISDIRGARSDAGVVALKTRSIVPADAVQQSLEALRALKEAGCEQFYFKYCSTFDSTKDGNIGPVAEALLRELGAAKAVVCPAFPANGRTVYLGHLFVGDTLLSESSMRDHPITPMTDSNIRRWLGYQCQGPVSHIAHQFIAAGAEAITQRVGAAPDGLIVCDAITDQDLRSIGRAAKDMALITGGSALAIGLPDNFRSAGRLSRGHTDFKTDRGPALILAGSCSAATNAQVDRYRRANPAFAIDGAALLAGYPVLEHADAFAREFQDRAPLIYSTITPDAVASGRVQADFGAASVAIEGLMANLALRARERGVTRLVVAGGETSGAVVEALCPGVMAVGPDVAPGVPLLAAGGISFALKSGNFGDENFFERALGMMDGTI